MALFPVNRPKQRHAEYDKFNKTQRFESDFDKAIKQIESSNTKGGKHE